MGLNTKIIALKNWLMSGKRKRPVTTIVMHATAGRGLSGAIEALKHRGLSYHYIINKDGTVTKCVPTDRAAWHAGVSEGPEGKWVNGYSIGVSLVNMNDGADPYTLAQRVAAIDLVKNLKLAIPTIKWLTTHWAVSPKRKTDPKNYPVWKLAELTKLKFWS